MTGNWLCSYKPQLQCDDEALSAVAATPPHQIKKSLRSSQHMITHEPPIAYRRPPIIQPHTTGWEGHFAQDRRSPSTQDRISSLISKATGFRQHLNQKKGVRAISLKTEEARRLKI